MRSWTTTSTSRPTFLSRSGARPSEPSWNRRLTRSPTSTVTSTFRSWRKIPQPWDERSRTSSSRPCTWSSMVSTGEERLWSNKPSTLTRLARRSSGKSTQEAEISQTWWNTMDGRSKGSTMTLDGILIAPLIDEPSWNYKMKYVLTSYGMHPSARIGPLCRTSTPWRRNDVKHLRLNENTRKRCIWRCVAEATLNRSEKGNMELWNNPAEHWVGKPRPWISLDMNATWTNASSAWPCQMRMGSTHLWRSPLDFNALILEWRQNLDGYALETTNTYPLRVVPQVSEIEPLHQLSISQHYAATLQPPLSTSSSTVTRTTNESLQNSWMKKLNKNYKTHYLPNYKHNLISHNHLTQTQNNLPQHLQVCWSACKMRTSKQQRGRFSVSIGTWAIPQRRSWFDFWRCARHQKLFYKRPKNMNVASVTFTRDQMESLSLACPKTSASMTASRQTPCGSKCLGRSTRPQSWWCQILWPDYLLPEFFDLRQPRSTSDSLSLRG